MKIFISVFFCLTSCIFLLDKLRRLHNLNKNNNLQHQKKALTIVVLMLILVGKKLKKIFTFKSRGESYDCINEEILGYECLPSLNYRGDYL